MARLKALALSVFLIAEALTVMPAGARTNDRLARATAYPSTLSVVSNDPYTNHGTYHRTQVEPDSAAFGSTIVSVFQSGRSINWGASNFGWSVSSDAGLTWTDEFLPGTTIHATPPGRWRRITDPAIAYDARHDTWLIVGEGMRHLRCGLAQTCAGARVFVSRSTDGGQTFGEPLLPARPDRTQFFDVPWIACDNFASSPFYGNCYMVWVDGPNASRLHAYTSADGGLTWSAGRIATPHRCADHPVLVVRPDGDVVIGGGLGGCDVLSKATFISTDGGKSYSGPFAIPTYDSRAPAHIRAWGIARFDVDAAGRVYAAVQDCAFRRAEEGVCTHNDIVLSTSDDGLSWTEMYRIPIDPVTSSADHFLPAIAVDPETSGASTHIAIVYYFHPDQWCDAETCDLYVGLASSVDGGSTWAVRTLAGPFKHTWFPLTDSGYMVGEYIGISFVDGSAIPVFPVASEGECVLGETSSCNVWTASATIPLGA
jgi:hypothetical protein